jgi:hypothetical protein
VWVVGDLDNFDFRVVLDLAMELFERGSVSDDLVIAQRNPSASIIRQSVVQLGLSRDLFGYGHVAPLVWRTRRGYLPDIGVCLD